MQRVAIARALVNDPDIILADEPTGALDTETSVQVMEILKEISDNRLVIMVTHNPNLADNFVGLPVEVSGNFSRRFFDKIRSAQIKGFESFGRVLPGVRAARTRGTRPPPGAAACPSRPAGPVLP